MPKPEWETISNSFTHPRWGLVVVQISTDGRERYQLRGKGCYGGSQVISAAQAQELIAIHSTPGVQQKDSSTRALEEMLAQRRLMQERAYLNTAINEYYGSTTKARRHGRWLTLTAKAKE